MPRGHREDPHREEPGGINYPVREPREKVGRRSQSNHPASFTSVLTKERVARERPSGRITLPGVN